MSYFVAPDSIVRRIWGSADTVLFIFAGAAAEFALNKAVDWLYFTGRLPAAPLDRLFSTVDYARRIVFADRAGAEKAIDTIAAIHGAVEAKRGRAIPDWAYRDVLFMLIGYSIRAFEVLERPLTETECAEIMAVFTRVGQRMGIPGLPTTYAAWQPARQQHLAENLAVSVYSADLYVQYRKHLGGPRYQLLRAVQGLVVPPGVRKLLALPPGALIQPAVAFYRRTKQWPASQWAKNAMLPAQYQARIHALDAVPAGKPAVAAQPSLMRCPMGYSH
ncbi:oxygenase MpaB family protein [Hymenobacter sp. M29]|uniref:Oxygenase MpaB family protein n=1 Tax=Hymenobacter mellowenesis TaxID=3063995 RepID=A0ABT9AAQ1_9BACT|nr:oxygenase MpaB family protein [Hymenobacter sp. M29]MDO7845812.1 oxygenase MpaB family protein [Hymenobacter sp. M29]